MSYIVIVEDERHVARLIERILSDHAYQTHVYSDGIIALKNLTITEPYPDALIIDVNIPSLNGFELAKALRQQPKPLLADIPIMMLTAQSSRESQLKGLEYADDYLTKPFDHDILLARVAALLRRKRGRSPILPSREVDMLVGETVRQYRIDSLVGRGGMGLVYKAYDSRLDREVALKFITTGFEDAQHQERFIREAQAASRLETPHICTVYTVEESEEGFLFMVMPYLVGQTLDSYLHRQDSYPVMPLERICDIMIQLCRGLATAHKAGIIHRDIKPSNIFLEKSGRVRLLDFGVAKWKSSDGMASMAPSSSQNVFMGTLAYMSPEQALSNQASFLSDVWALGVVLYELLTGRNPFSQGQGFASLISMIIQENPRALPTEVAIFQPIIDRLLQKKPVDRYKDLALLEQDIDQLVLPVDIATMQR